MSPEEKIEAAQKLIDEARAEFAAKKRNWLEEAKPGMLFRSNGKVVAIPPRHPVDHAISLDPERIGMSCYGWENAPDIEYLGHARDILKIADDAHEPTGAELVGKATEYELGPDDVIEASDDMCRNGHSERRSHNWCDFFPHGITVKDARNQCKSAIRFFRKAVR